MASQVNYNRQTRLYILAEVCKQNHLTPDSPGYIGLIIRVCTSKFGLSHDSAKEHAETLSSAYCADKWQTITATDTADEPNNEATTQPRILEETKPRIQGMDLKIESRQEIKHIKPQLNLNLEKTTPKQTAKMFYDVAKHNTNPDNIGRLLLSDCRDIADNKHIQIQDVINLWKKYYPVIDIEQRTGNVLLIFWDGKEATQNNRRLIKPIIRSDNIFSADKDGVFTKEEYYDTDEFMAHRPKDRIW